MQLAIIYHLCRHSRVGAGDDSLMSFLEFRALAQLMIVNVISDICALAQYMIAYRHFGHTSVVCTYKVLRNLATRLKKSINFVLGAIPEIDGHGQTRKVGIVPSRPLHLQSKLSDRVCSSVLACSLRSMGRK